MIKKTFYTAFLFLIFLSSAHAVIFEVEDLTKLEQELSTLDSSSLVLFDIDYTILTLKDAALKPCGKALWRRHLHQLDPQRREWLQSLLYLEGGEELMDSAFPILIKQMQEKKIPVMALTFVETGEYGKIHNVEEMRPQILEKYDIDFSSTFHDKGPIIFSELKPFKGNYPVFKSGILFTNRQPKGDVLIAFLKKIEWMPHRILFIDDSLDQLLSVEAAAQTLGIPFIGLHYIAAETRSYQYDEAIADFQFRYLVENGKWLTDAEALLLKHRQPTLSLNPGR